MDPGLKRVHPTHAYPSENRAAANLWTVYNQTGRTVPKWNLSESPYVAMESPKDCDPSPQTQHSSRPHQVLVADKCFANSRAGVPELDIV